MGSHDKGVSLDLTKSLTTWYKGARSSSSLVHDAAEAHVATESEHLANLQPRLQTTHDNTRAMLCQLENPVVVPDDDAWWRSSGAPNARNCFPYSHPMPKPLATHPEWIWFETQLRESPHMLNTFSLWCVKHNRQKWGDLDLVSKSLFLTQWRGLSHIPERCTGPPRGLALTCSTSFKLPHSCFSNPLLTPFYSYSVWHNSVPCWGSMGKTRPNCKEASCGVMAPSPTTRPGCK